MTDPEAILELVAKRGRALVSARALFIELVNDDGSSWPPLPESGRRA